MTAEWYVLIEEDTRTTERPDGVELRLHRWMLVGTYHIGQDEAEAVAAAEDAALNYIRGVLTRHAFLAQDGAWVVLVRQRHRECHIRVTAARLMHSLKEKEARPLTASWARVSGPRAWRRSRKDRQAGERSGLAGQAGAKRTRGDREGDTEPALRPLRPA
ncbi:hypothetical protein, partial [Streptomyces sp. NPDC046727]|uniref:hypothetical protein n=1 Tax=Streptomyces sp. NPDC046727 TaxID=3155373 RepID=UPI0033F2FBBE